MKFFNINRKLLPIKLHYALFNAGVCVHVVMPVFARSLGFSTYAVGVIYTILPLISLVLKPIFAAITDKYKWHKQVTIVWIFLTGIGFFSIWFIPRDTVVDPWTIAACGGPSPYFNVSNGNCSYSCDITQERCNNWGVQSLCSGGHAGWYNYTTEGCSEFIRAGSNITLDVSDCLTLECSKNSTSDNTASDAVTFASFYFWLFVFFLSLGWVGIDVVGVLNDTINIEICEDSTMYGEQRLWGSVTWGLFSMGTGLIIDSLSDGEDKNYLPAFIIMLPPLILDILVCFKLKFSIPAKSNSIALDTLKIFKKPRNLIFMVWYTAAGASSGLWHFLFWLLEDLAAAQGPSVSSNIKTIEGLATGIETFIGETLAFFFSGWVIRKVGHEHAMTIVFVIMSVRFSLYSLLVNPWWCLPIEVLQMHYGLFCSTTTSYAKRIAPPGTEATTQSVLGSVCGALGVAIGSYLGGYLYDIYGGPNTFLIFGVTYGIMAVVNELVELWYRISCPNNPKQHHGSAQSFPLNHDQ